MPLRMLPRQEYSYSSLALQREYAEVPSTSREYFTVCRKTSNEKSGSGINFRMHQKKFGIHRTWIARTVIDLDVFAECIEPETLVS
jgi:predicted transcriptional regulator of viral defense system